LLSTFCIGSTLLSYSFKSTTLLSRWNLVLDEPHPSVSCSFLNSGTDTVALVPLSLVRSWIAGSHTADGSRKYTCVLLTSLVSLPLAGMMDATTSWLSLLPC
jgi:hypothetical protein